MQRRAEIQKNKTEAWRKHEARVQHEEGHSIGRVCYIASLEPSDTPHGSQLSRICTQRHSIYNTLFVLTGFQASLSAQPTPLAGESLGRSNQSGSKTSQACYGYPRCISLPDFGRFFLFPHPRAAMNLQPIAPFALTVLSVPGTSRRAP